MKRVFISPDGIRYVFQEDAIKVNYWGKWVLINGHPVFEYFSEDDARLAVESIREDFSLELDEQALPVKHF